MIEQLFSAGGRSSKTKRPQETIYTAIFSGRIRTQYPQAVIHILQTWENLPGLQQWQSTASRPYPKYLKDAAHYIDKLLQGTAFVDNLYLTEYENIKWSVETITTSMRRYHLAATNLLYFPANQETKKTMQKRTIMDFLWKPPYEVGTIDIWVRSPLLYYHFNIPALNADAVPKKEPENPAFFAMFTQMYEAISPCRAITIKEHNMVVLAATRYHTWYKQNKNSLPNECRSASFVIDAIREHLSSHNTEALTLLYICSLRLFTDVTAKLKASVCALPETEIAIPEPVNF